MLSSWVTHNLQLMQAVWLRTLRQEKEPVQRPSSWIHCTPALFRRPNSQTSRFFRFVRAETDEATNTKRQTKAITPSADVGVRAGRGEERLKTQKDARADRSRGVGREEGGQLKTFADGKRQISAVGASTFHILRAR